MSNTGPESTVPPAAPGGGGVGLRPAGAAAREGRAVPVRVLLVEDNQVFREALELLLGLREDVVVVGSVADGGEAVPAAHAHRPDVVLVDYRLPVLDGVEATRALREALPDVAVVCLTASATPREREALLEAGAVVCLSKDQELDEIVAAIRRAAGSVAA